MELLTPTTPIGLDRGTSITARFYYSKASTSSSSSPDLATSISAASTALTIDSDDDHSDDEALPSCVRPKVEEIDDDADDINGQVHDASDAKPPVGIVSLPSPPPRKKRGRPRKHPLIVDTTETRKAAHARSKTGCGTCRRRKKKCDETKPACMNCEKNNVVCVGYEPKQPWRSGKQRALQKQTIPAQLPNLKPGVETEIDNTFLDRFVDEIGQKLALTDEFNPFREVIIPMAFQNLGLMHSVLFLSSTCLIFGSPGCGDIDYYLARRNYHRSQAIGILGKGAPALNQVAPSNSSFGSPIVSNEVATTQQTAETSLAPHLTSDDTIAQTLMMCLETIASGSCCGGFRMHINALKLMLSARGNNFPNQKLRNFIVEFLLYHDFSSAITSLRPTVDARSMELMKDFQLPPYVQPGAGSLLGVLDGLFGLISQIRLLRDKVRARNRPFWYSDPEIRDTTTAIDQEIREWKCCYPPESSRFKTSMLYRQATWVYLYRTVYESRSHPTLREAVGKGLELLRDVLWDNKDGGAVQSVLLLPLFVLGCAAFEPEHRRDITKAFNRLRLWSCLANIKRAEQILEDLWQLMDEGREEESWDWEGLLEKKDWDLLIT